LEGSENLKHNAIHKLGAHTISLPYNCKRVEVDCVGILDQEANLTTTASRMDEQTDLLGDCCSALDHDPSSVHIREVLLEVLKKLRNEGNYTLFYSILPLSVSKGNLHACSRKEHPTVPPKMRLSFKKEHVCTLAALSQGNCDRKGSRTESNTYYIVCPHERRI
jgi:hypothetical protein